MNNQKRILCFVDKYYPESSANTQCASFVMQKFVDEGHIVDYMCIKEDFSIPSLEKKDGHIVYRFETYITKNLKLFGKFFKAKSWIQMPWVFRKAVGLLYKIKSFSRLYTEAMYIDCLNYDSIVNSIKKQNVTYDAVVAFSYPFALHVIAKEIVENKLAKKWFAIFLDPFVFNYCLRPRRIEKRKKTAQKVLSSADKIFMVRGIKKEDLKNGYSPDYHKKVVEIEMPNLTNKNIDCNERKEKNKETILTFAGLFYKNIRNPEKMLDILSQMPNNIKVKILGRGCYKILKKKSKLFINNNLEILGQVPYDECIKTLNSSNILVNLGNTIPNQTPSKVFEYIAIGKPIINFYFNEEDTSLYYLKKYPKCFNINLNNYSANDIEELIEFIEKEKDNVLSFEEATINLVETRSENVTQKIFNEIIKDI